MLQSDKGISSIRLAEALGVSQPTAWRMGHALRLMVGREQALDGVVEIDGLYVGASRGGIQTILHPDVDAKASRRP
jgi:hypothetical protein